MDVPRLGVALLVSAATAATGLVVTAPAQAASPLLSFPSKATVKEGSEAKITIRLNKKMTAAGTVRFATSALTASRDDFLVEKGTLDIAMGKRSVTLSVFSEGDPIDEADETFKVTLSRPRGVRMRRGKTTITVTITDDDPTPAPDLLTPPVFGEPGAAPTPVPPEANVRTGDGKAAGSGSGGTTGTIIDDRPTLQVNDVETNEASLQQPTIAIGEPYSKDVTVDWALSSADMEAGVDYTSASGTVTIPAGQTAAGVGVALQNDNWDDAPDVENATLTFSNPTNAKLIDTTSAIAVSDDDPTPVISIPDVANKVPENSAAQFLVTLSHPSETAGFADVQTYDGSAHGGDCSMYDYIAVHEVLQFPPGTTSVPQAVETCSDMAISESDEDFILKVDESNFVIAEDSSGLATIENVGL